MYIGQFISQLSRILFEPIFVLALCGVILMLLRRKKIEMGLKLLLVFLALMLLWRSGLNLLSKRYSQIFIFPGLVLTVYFCYSLPAWLQQHFPQCASRGKNPAFNLRISRALIGLVLLICVGKLLNYNRFDRSFIAACQQIRQSATTPEKRLILESCGEAHRIKFYTQTDTISLLSKCPDRDQWRHIANLLKQFPGREIFWVQLTRATSTAPSQLTGRCGGTWEQIFTAPRDNRRKKYWQVYQLRRTNFTQSPVISNAPGTDQNR